MTASASTVSPLSQTAPFTAPSASNRDFTRTPVRSFAPLLLGQFVTLVKDTSIVGYIAVQDLTRVGDLIRARTMEAFFPIIAIAIIYFALCRLLAWLPGKFIKRLGPKDGQRTIKGVEL